MNKGYFSISFEGGERISPEQFGYLLIKWSHEGAMAALNGLKGTEYSKSPLATAILRNGFLGYIQLLAIHAATYTFYVSKFLRVPNEVHDQVRIGIDNAIKVTRNGNGDFLDSSQAQFLRGSIGAYQKANNEDFSSSQVDDGDAFKVDAIAQKFFEITTPLFPEIKGVSALDHLLLGNVISELPTVLCKALKEDIRLSYVA